MSINLWRENKNRSFASGITIFETLLYISLFALLSGLLSSFTLQSYSYISDIKGGSARFKAAYLITEYIQYFADTTESITVESVNNESGILVFKSSNRFEKRIGFTEIVRLTKSIVDIEYVQFEKRATNNLNYIEVTYKLGGLSCMERKNKLNGSSCVEKISINLI